jgi:hypothetical protein
MKRNSSSATVGFCVLCVIALYAGAWLGWTVVICSAALVLLIARFKK